MGIEFHGDIDNVSDHVKNVCAKLLEGNGHVNSKVEVQAVGKKGDNYGSIIKRLIITDEGEEENLQIIMKVSSYVPGAPEFLKTFMNAAFVNEVVTYTEILPRYDEFQLNAGIPEDKLYGYPRCYGYHLEPPSEILLLEDLKVTGFQILNRLIPYTDEQVLMTLGELAKYHALSFVLRYKDPVFFNEISNKICNFMVQQEDIPEMSQLYSGVEDSCFGILDDEYKPYLKGVLKNLLKTARQLNKADEKSKHAVILQGDCWTNNMLFKFENDKPLALRMVDYQLTRVASPAIDLLYFLLNSTDYKSRKARYYDWLDHYYKTIEDLLSDCDLKANFVFPREKLDADLKRYAKLGMGLAIMTSSIISREQEDVLDFTPEDFAANPDFFTANSMKETSMNRFKGIMVGIIDSLKDFGYLQ